ncbi:MAG: DsbA family oxidoreductase [Cyanobacteria bacterium P01_A01_bin.123]
MTKLPISVTSDFICPWCWVAETRLRRTIEQLQPAVDIEWIWYPFELNPDMPAAGIDRKTYRSNKFGSWAYSQQLDAQTIQAAENDDIEFRYDLMEFTPNTLKAHRLTQLAGQQGKATEMAERILRAYFHEGQNIGDVDTLMTLASEVGLDVEQVSAFLQATEGIQDIRALERQAAARGVRSVPTIQIGNQTVVGAQPLEVLVNALQTAIDQLSVTNR